ncbi:hypothetical protein FBUS_06530 [Fasciolopsis buskii]|uniref:SCP domain-containing protein n=1 Tax=Fasciolopsis buskii TaxID=27845 RepID=A0A8E0RYC7_9TREM|nr:hypothetical protein FBUS_06530 [Fasciolopsis buski]
MDRWKFVLCPLLLMLSKSIAREVETLEQLNEKMLKWHNELRTKVLKCKLEGQPPAKVMPNLTYDPNLARTAQKWADKCVIGHDKDSERNPGGYTQVGQNFAGDYTLQG